MNKILILILPLLLLGCGKNHWQGYVYLDKSDKKSVIETDTYTSLESCRSAAWTVLLDAEAVDKGFYECGMNCQPSLVTETSRNCEKLAR